MNKVYVLQRDLLLPNGHSGITYGRGTVVKSNLDNQLYYTFPEGQIIWHELVENNSEWFKEEIVKEEIGYTEFVKAVEDGRIFKNTSEYSHIWYEAWKAAEKHFTKSELPHEKQ